MGAGTGGAGYAYLGVATWIRARLIKWNKCGVGQGTANSTVSNEGNIAALPAINIPVMVIYFISIKCQYLMTLLHNHIYGCAIVMF